MKTFNEKDLITWSNKYNAKIKTFGYFANSINELKKNINAGKIRLLESISADYERCFNCCLLTDHNVSSYGFFLPKDAVKENKTYRPCRTVQELYDLIFNIKSTADTELYINELLGVNIHFRDKETGTEYFTTISSITKDINDYVKVIVSPKGYLSFTDLFNKYEIEVEGEFKPFGVTDET